MTEDDDKEVVAQACMGTADIIKEFGYTAIEPCKDFNRLSRFLIFFSGQILFVSKMLLLWFFMCFHVRHVSAC